MIGILMFFSTLKPAWPLFVSWQLLSEVLVNEGTSWGSWLVPFLDCVLLQAKNHEVGAGHWLQGLAIPSEFFSTYLPNGEKGGGI